MNKWICLIILLLFLPFRMAVAGNWSVGGGAIFAPNPYLDTKVNILGIPVISYNDRYVSWYGPYLKLRYPVNRQNIIGALAYLDMRVFDPKDTSNAQLSVLNKRNRLFMVGGFYRHRAAYGDISISLSGDVTGNTNGFASEVSYAYPWSIQQRKYFLKPSIGARWSDSKITNHFFGVSPSEALRSGLPFYQANNALTPFVGLFAGAHIFKKLFWMGSVRANYVVNTIYQSPMVSNRRINFSFLTGLTWEFGGRKEAFKQ